MKTVLTVDDSRLVRTTLANALAPWGCRVLEARNGREGLGVARRVRPDLLLLDVLMPVLDGPQTLAVLRRDPICRHIPVIMLTAVAGESLVEECAYLGVSGYLVKPFTQESFVQLVGGVLGSPLGLSLSAPSAAARIALPG